MANDNHILSILETLSDEGIEFVIGGGVAVVLHGVERATMDIDLSLRMNDKNIRAFLNVMSQLGLKPRGPIPGEALLDPETIRSLIETKQAIVFSFVHPEEPFTQVGIFLESALAYDKLVNDCETKKIGRLQFKLLSLSQVIAIKKSIQRASPSDYDGHTAFDQMSAEARLHWLSATAKFLYLAKQSQNTTPSQ